MLGPPSAGKLQRTLGFVADPRSPASPWKLRVARAPEGLAGARVVDLVVPDASDELEPAQPDAPMTASAAITAAPNPRSGSCHRGLPVLSRLEPSVVHTPVHTPARRPRFRSSEGAAPTSRARADHHRGGRAWSGRLGTFRAGCGSQVDRSRRGGEFGGRLWTTSDQGRSVDQIHGDGKRSAQRGPAGAGTLVGSRLGEGPGDETVYAASAPHHARRPFAERPAAADRGGAGGRGRLEDRRRGPHGCRHGGRAESIVSSTSSTTSTTSTTTTTVPAVAAPVAPAATPAPTAPPATTATTAATARPRPRPRRAASPARAGARRPARPRDHLAAADVTARHHAADDGASPARARTKPNGRKTIRAAWRSGSDTPSWGLLSTRGSGLG